MKIIKFSWYLITRLPFIAIYELLHGLSRPLKGSKRMNLAFILIIFLIAMIFMVANEIIYPLEGSTQPQNLLMYLYPGVDLSVKLMMGLAVWSLLGAFIVRLLYRKSTPTQRLKAKFQEYFGERNEVHVVPQSTKQTDDIESIKDRLPDHLKDLISKK